MREEEIQGSKHRVPHKRKGEKLQRLRMLATALGSDQLLTVVHSSSAALIYNPLALYTSKHFKKNR
jgi:hypothetical protein